MKASKEDPNWVLLKSIQDMLEKEKLEDTEKLLAELYSIYSNLSNLSQRLMRVLKQTLPEPKSRIGLSNFILTLLETKGPSELKQIQKAVEEDFEYTVSRKSITDSLQYLIKKPHGISRRYNRKTKKSEFIKRGATGDRN